MDERSFSSEQKWMAVRVQRKTPNNNKEEVRIEYIIILSLLLEKQ